MRLRICLFTLLLLPAAASDQPWHRRDGPFEAMLAVTDRLDEFINGWSKTQAAGHPPRIKPPRAAKRGDVVWGVVLFSHCKADKSGRCRTEADFTVLRPDGSTHSTHYGAEVWRGKPPAPPKLQISTARLGFHIEKADPLGAYKIRAVVKDLEAERQVTVEQTLVVAETK